MRKLFEQNSMAKSNYDAARASSESAKAAVESVEKQLELAKLHLSYTRLIAPVSGAIAAVNIEANENAAAGQPVVDFTAGSEIEVKLFIPEILISKINEGSEVTVTFDAIPDKKFTATILEVGIASGRAGTTYPVTVRLNQKDDTILPGMAANIACRFEPSDERERFIVPSHSVVEDRRGRFVFVVQPIPGETGLGTIHRKPVTIGEIVSEGLEIFEGITDGDLVVIAGMSRISEGQKVKI